MLVDLVVEVVLLFQGPFYPDLFQALFHPNHQGSSFFLENHPYCYCCFFLHHIFLVRSYLQLSSTGDQANK